MSCKNKLYRAAVYVRLSKEDNDIAKNGKVESDSISNQKSLILNFLKDKDDIEVVSIREDDGYSGSSFERPGFQLMMQDVRDGKVNCIVVKDLSRFAREYIDAGRYIERLFPAMGVRFIAVNDNYDSAADRDQADEIVIPFKNLINDAYCRDMSVKIRSHLEVKRQNGEYVGNYCPYGYMKSPGNRNALVVDEYAGHIVQDLFRWVKGGMSLDAASRRLNGMSIKPPMEHKRASGINYRCPFRKSGESGWTAVTVRRIVTNPVYTGILIQGKRTTPNHKIRTTVLKEREKWAVSENAHEALVSGRDFRIVQRILATDMRTAPGRDTVYPLSGLAVCADCGALMARKDSTVGGKHYAYYMCSANKKRQECSHHRIREDVLEAGVTEAVRDMIAQLTLCDEIIRKAGERQNRTIDAKKRAERLRHNEEEIRKCTDTLVSLYEDYRAGVVDKEDFMIIKKRIESRRKTAECAVARLTEEGNADGDLREREARAVEEFRKYGNITRLTRDIAVNILSSVKVHEGGRIDVILDCDDEYRRILERARSLTSGDGNAGEGRAV